jgi:hypothetical protein
VGLLLLDDALNPRIVVSRDDHEAVATLYDLAVFTGTELERLEAGLAVALAMKAHRRGDPMELGSLFDLFVDTPEHLLVPGCSLCEIHVVLYPRRRFRTGAA